MNDNYDYQSICDLITWRVLIELEGEKLRFVQLKYIDALDWADGDYEEFFEDLRGWYFKDDYQSTCDLITWAIVNGHESKNRSALQMKFADDLDSCNGNYKEFFDKLFSMYFETDKYCDTVQIPIANITKGYRVCDFDDLYRRSDALEKELYEWRLRDPNTSIRCDGHQVCDFDR
jgi:hypothetical protein